MPVRTCIGCRGQGSPGDFIRIARTQDGARVWAGSGRSAYVHPTRICVDRALSKAVLDRALRIAIPRDEKEALRAELERKLR